MYLIWSFALHIKHDINVNHILNHSIGNMNYYFSIYFVIVLYSLTFMVSIKDYLNSYLKC